MDFAITKYITIDDEIWSLDFYSAYSERDDLSFIVLETKIVDEDLETIECIDIFVIYTWFSTIDRETFYSCVDRYMEKVKQTRDTKFCLWN